MTSNSNFPFRSVRLGLAFFFILFMAVASWAWEGDGSSSTPYMIKSCSDLVTLRDNVNGGTAYDGKYFEQNGDIDCSGSTWNAPIGKDESYRFGGNYNGGGFKIKNLTISANTKYVGLFGFVRGESNGMGGFAVITLQNIVLEDCDIQSTATDSYAGGICAKPQTVHIENCRVSGNIKADYAAGGIVGDYNISRSVFVKGCFADVSVNAKIQKGYGNQGQSVKYCVTGKIFGKAGLGNSNTELNNNYYYDDGATNANGESVTAYGHDNSSTTNPDDDRVTKVYKVSSSSLAIEGASITHGDFGYFEAGATVKLKAKANHIIETIGGVDASISNDKKTATFTMPSNGVTITATTSEVHTLSVPEGMTLSDPYITIGNVKYYKKGVTYTFTAPENNIIESFTATGAQSSSVSDDKRSASLTIGSANVTTTASLTEVHTVTAQDGITLSEAYTNILGTDYYKYGQKVTFGFSGSGSVKYFVNGVRIEGNSVTLGHENLTVQMGVPYIDENGEEQVCKPGEFTVLTSTTGVSNLPGGWYVVLGKVSYTNSVKFSKDAYLILADGAKMEIETEGESENGIYASKNLTIYGQSGQSGILKASAKGSDCFGIYSIFGNVTISGGSVTAAGEKDYGIYGSKGVTISGGSVTATGGKIGIFGYDGVSVSGGSVTAAGEKDYGIFGYDGISVSGGVVTATGKFDGIYSIFGNVTISGGTVTATSENGSGINGYKGVTISGGTVTATGGICGIDSFNGNITLSWAKSTDAVKASSYVSQNGSVIIADGKSFKDEDGNVYSGTLNSDQLSAIKGKTLTPCYAVAFDLQDGKDPVMHPATFNENGVAHVAKPDDPTRSGFKFLGWFTTKDGDTEFDLSAEITGNTTTAYAKWGVPYIDENGKEQVRKPGEYTVLTKNIEPNKDGVISLTGGWYVVLGDVRYSNTVKFSEDAHLILADGAKMKIVTDGQLEHGIYASKNLTIYGQSGQRGTLDITAKGLFASGIFDEGNVMISGGHVSAAGKSNYGIYGNNVMISGGRVSATSSSPIHDGIFGKGNVTISGGNVTATSKGNYGIYGNNVTISGGTVTATGDFGDGIFSDGNIALSWTNSTDNIKASSYVSQNGSVTIADGKSFTDEDGKVYSGTLNDEQLSAIEDMTLTPCYAVAFDLQDGKDPVMRPATFDKNGVAHVAKLDDPTRSGFKFLGWFTTKDGDTEFDFSAAITGNTTTAYAKWSVSYVDENGKEQVRKPGEYTLLTSTTDVSYLKGGWYVVQGEVSYTSQVTFNGDTYLILADGAKLEIETKGNSEHGIETEGNLTIYGQNAQSGILKATANGDFSSGIYCSDNVTIIGGTVTATGEYGIRTYNGNISLSWTNLTDNIKASSYASADGSVIIADGKSFVDEEYGKVYSGTLNDVQLYAIKGMTLTPCYAVAFDLQDGKDPVMRPATFDENGVAHVAKPADRTRSGFKFLGWFTAKDGDTEFDFSAAITGNTTIYAKWQEKDPIEYIDENGEPKSTKDYVLLTSNMDVSDLPGGWYVVQGEVSYTSQVKFSKDAYLILADGAELTVDVANGGAVFASENLSIYGQSGQSGTLTVKGDDFGIYSQSNITISGGSVTATGKSEYGIMSIFGNVSISGGSVMATGKINGIKSEFDIILSLNNSSDDYIKASGFHTLKGTVKVAEGKSLKDENGNVYRGTLSQSQVSAIKGQVLKPFTGTVVSFVDNSSETPTVFAEIAVDKNGYVAAPAKHPFRSGKKFVGWYEADGVTEFNFNEKITASTVAYAKWEDNALVEYIDENGKTKSVSDYVLLTNDIYVDDLPGGWYVVQGKVCFTSQVTFNGDANLILADDAKMEIESEGDEEHGIYALRNLTIYGQSGQSGILAAIGEENGIYSSGGDVSINGGIVKATGKIYGIYCKSGVMISGGNVTATGKSDYGIFGQRCVTISGGNVTATGNDYGIYGYYNGVTISGGKVTASGNSSGINTNAGHITLGWTNSTDYIYASGYYSENGISIAEGKSFKDEDGKAYSGTINRVSDIAGKTLVPPSFNGKFLSGVNIAVADIPVQKYADGKPVCPSVVVTDGKDTLTAGSDYTVTCFNNTAVSSATLDEAAIAQITGKGNYAGAIQKRFFIWKNIRDYAAVQVFQDAGGKTHAEIDGAYDGTDAVAIDEDVAVDTVVFSREFTVNLENGGFSTIMLPFDVSASNLTGVKSIFEFNGVDNGKNTVGVNYVWCNAKQGKIEKDNNHPDCNKLSGELNAYTPYMVEMDTPTLGINGKVTLKSSNNATNSVVSKSNWVFRGALKKKEWSKEDDDIKNGQIWAFAGSARNGASIGKFVQFGGNNWVNPFRAYLVDCTTYPDASECKDETQPEPSFVSRYRFADVLAPATSAENSLSAKTPAAVAASETALLNSMDIVIVYGDSASGERPTVIGRMNPATGEIRMLPRTKQTYDLKGRKVGNGKKAKGAYYSRR